ncbi:MAG: DNA topoisomerase III [Alphaproteobacteria bacterium 41-28]|nr:MAG: DNA topoisomerase III [Alphaproteobacteria bacterium 41-28]
MRLFIAEKPSVARAIAGELGETGKGDGFIQCATDKVTWCFGHMFEQAEPDEYTHENVPRNTNGKKIWRVDELPIIPKNWILRPKIEAKKQLALIGKLIKEAKEIVNAGDPDREGQLLVDEILEHFHNTKPVRRFWVSAQDSVSIKRGLDALTENGRYRGWANAARGRQWADWLIGMNLSRAYTLRAQRGGSQALLTVGRVQTPTLALVVRRDREIEAFKPAPYHTLLAEIQHPGGTFVAAWKVKENQAGLDSEGRLVDTVVANAVVETIKGKQGTISVYIQEPKKKNQPLVFALSDITVLASNKYGYSAEDVLNTCQALYETHKLTSYPRTDCAYLPESQYADAPSVLKAIKHVNPELSSLVDGADPGIKSKTWDDTKITAHHGIVPTMHKGDKAKLSARERNIYDLIVRAYLAQFYPHHEYMSTTVNVDIAGETFAASGKVVTSNGWCDVFEQAHEDTGKERDESSRQKLPTMKQGDSVTCIEITRKDTKTKPPARFTEGTLTRAMENIHQFVDDSEHKKLLRAGDGIGTSATRASIISELKRRKFLELTGKHIISTPLGRSVIDALPDDVKSPVLTALFERMLKEIELGTAELESFIAKQEAFIRDQVMQANSSAVTIIGDKETAEASALHKCMVCCSGLARRPSKKKGHFWWGCSNFPNCKQTYPDLKGRPDYSVQCAVVSIQK